MSYRSLVPLLALLLLPSLGGCAATPAGGCKVGADCASGVCNADGTCGGDSTSTTTSGGTTTTGGSGGSGGASSTSTGATTSSSSTGAGGSGGGGACSPPNNDGIITQDELPAAVGLHENFGAAANVPVDTVGKVQADGSHLWDLSAMISGEAPELVTTLPIAGQWFAASFPNATYASRLSSTADLLGIFEVAAGSLLLRGVASPSDGPKATNLVYTTPIKVLVFPIKSGDTWTTLSAVTGKVQGITVGGIYNEQYDSKVDATGIMKTPFASFPVLRIRVNRVAFLNGITTTSHRFVFVTECFGTVATMVSKDSEQTDEFTTAAEVSRLAP
ncbi:MAG: hypothetical protein ABJE95_07565 [Byssovorax sp.]